MVQDVNGNIIANNVLDGYTTTATAASTTTLTVASAYQQFFTGSTTQTVVLPVTSTLVLGQSFYIVNNSSGAVTVQSSGANNIQVMASGTTLRVTCVLTSGTTAASWSAVYSSSGGGGSGTVNSGTSGQLAYYAASGTAVSGLTTITNSQNGVTMTQKKGSAAGGVYTSTSTSLVDVDATNLSYAVTIPSGYKLHIVATGSFYNGTINDQSNVALTDISTSTVLNEQQMNAIAASYALPFALNAIVTGDGASHTIRLQFSVVSGSVNILNGGNIIPVITFMLMPSN
jgi:hypothetical protein